MSYNNIILDDLLISKIKHKFKFTKINKVYMKNMPSLNINNGIFYTNSIAIEGIFYYFSYGKRYYNKGTMYLYDTDELFNDVIIKNRSNKIKRLI